jgi:hypothetical protein
MACTGKTLPFIVEFFRLNLVGSGEERAAGAFEHNSEASVFKKARNFMPR